jgi:hypothetical protein
VLRRWDHDVVVERLDDDRSRYTDPVLVDAGPVTMPVAMFAWLFYRYRQRRWRKLVRASTPTMAAWRTAVWTRSVVTAGAGRGER